jgi:hypothetical protein
VSGFIWPRTGTTGCWCEHGNEISGSVTVENALSTWATVHFSRRTILHSVCCLLQDVRCKDIATKLINNINFMSFYVCEIQIVEGPKLIPWHGFDFFFPIVNRLALRTIWHPVQWLPGSVRARTGKVISHFQLEPRFMRGAAPPSSWLCA